MSIRNACRWGLAVSTLAATAVLVPAAAGADPTFGVMNASGGIYWRSGPDWNTAEAVAGNGFYPNTTIAVHCYQSGAGNIPGSADTMWEQASVVGGSGTGSGWINEHFINDGAAINQPSPGVPPCNAPPPSPAPAPAPAPASSGGNLVFPVYNADGGVYYRNSPNQGDTSQTPGVGVYNGDQVKPICGQFGGAGPNGNTAWSYVQNLTRPNIGNGWVNEHFINDGAAINALPGGEPTPCPSSIQGAGSSSSPGPTGAETQSPSAPPAGSICSPRYGGSQRTVSVSHGTQTRYDRQASVYHVVCGRFGAPAGLNFSPTMQCALLAAAATYGGPVINRGIGGGCGAASILSDLAAGHWLGAIAGLGCGYFSDIFAGAVGIFVAGATSETGPGAVLIGVRAYKLLAASLKVVCGLLFDGGANALGQKLESIHETHVSVDVLRHRGCLRLSHVFGRWSWSAAAC